MSNYYEVAPEESQFYTVIVDLTHKCNMACANCYSPRRDIPDDFTTEQVEDFMTKLKTKSEIRFAGGEPTLRSDLPYLISRAKALGHRPALMTNGLKLAKLEYCEELKEAGLRFVCLSMNGGDDDKIYKIMDNMACAEKKVQALENCAKVGFFTNVNSIIVRDLSEMVPRFIARKMQEIGARGTIRIKNIGQIGRYMKTENYSFDELKVLVPQILEISEPQYDEYKVVNGFEEEHNVLFPLDASKPYTGIWIKITDWAPPGSIMPDPGSTRRGRLTKSLKVAPFFETVKLLGY